MFQKIFKIFIIVIIILCIFSNIIYSYLENSSKSSNSLGILDSNNNDNFDFQFSNNQNFFWPTPRIS